MQWYYLFYIVGGGILVYGLYGLWAGSELKRRGVRTEAKIIDVRTSVYSAGEREGEPTGWVTVIYTYTAQGREYQSQLPNIFGLTAHRKKDEVLQVVYDPAKPAKATADCWRGFYGKPTLNIIFGGLFVLVGVSVALGWFDALITSMNNNR